MSKKIGQLDLKKQITAFLKEKGCPQSFLTIWNHLLKINNNNNKINIPKILYKFLSFKNIM